MQLLDDYKASLKNPAIEESVDLLLFRPLGFLFVKAVYPTSLTPNQVTLCSMAVGVVSGLCYAIGADTTAAAGGILLGVATVFDCADGQLARLKGNGSYLGRVLDGVADYIYTFAAFLGIALGCRNGSMSLGMWWVFVAAAGASYAVQAGLIDYYRNEYLAHASGRRSFLDEEIEGMTAEHERLLQTTGRHLEKFLLSVYLRYSKFQNTINRTRAAASEVTASEYFSPNGLLIHLWSINGTSTHVFVLILCSLFGRVDLFLWYVLLFGSLYYAVLYGIQKYRAG